MIPDSSSLRESGTNPESNTELMTDSSMGIMNDSNKVGWKRAFHSPRNWAEDRSLKKKSIRTAMTDCCRIPDGQLCYELTAKVSSVGDH